MRGGGEEGISRINAHFANQMCRMFCILGADSKCIQGKYAKLPWNRGRGGKGGWGEGQEYQRVLNH
jgi:hypothetical protein